MQWTIDTLPNTFPRVFDPQGQGTSDISLQVTRAYGRRDSRLEVLFVDEYSSTPGNFLNVNRGSHSANFITYVDRRLSVYVGPMVPPAVHDCRAQGIPSLPR